MPQANKSFLSIVPQDDFSNIVEKAMRKLWHNKPAGLHPFLWRNLWMSLGAVLGLHDYEKLIICYQEPHRAYHTLTHINECLTEMKKVEKAFEHPAVVIIAIWYHDIIYDTRAHDNEEKSAQCAREIMKRTGFPDYFSGYVEAMILATKHTESATLSRDAEYFLDIDLAILGKEPSQFDVYEKQIRQEYIWVDEVEYKKGRTKVLSSFIEKPLIYRTEYFRARYEEQARINIERSLAKLR